MSVHIGFLSGQIGGAVDQFYHYPDWVQDVGRNRAVRIRSKVMWKSSRSKMIPDHQLIFFSVLRLCGSRQVVAPCRADERITQMHSLYPSLGVQKWSKITTKWCQFQNEKPTKTQQKTNTHNPHPKQHQTKTKRKREHGMTAPKSNGIKCF